MTMDFSGAERQKDFSVLIPQGTLSWGVLKIKPYNIDQGLWEQPSKDFANTGVKYLNCEVHLVGGQYDKRVVFTRIGTAGNKENYINMGKAAIRAILEVGKQASEQNVAGYSIEHYKDLNGLQVAIKVKEEPEQNGYGPKNDVAVFLSPVDPVTKADFDRLVAGDTEPKGKQAIRSGGGGGGAPAQAAPAARWAQGAQPAQPPAQPAVNPAQAPAWLQQPQNPGQAAPARPDTAATPPASPQPAAATPPWASAAPQG